MSTSIQTEVILSQVENINGVLTRLKTSVSENKSIKDLNISIERIEQCLAVIQQECSKNVTNNVMNKITDPEFDRLMDDIVGKNESKAITTKNTANEQKQNNSQITNTNNEQPTDSVVTNTSDNNPASKDPISLPV